jgi:steroid Delta-isomerase
VSLLDDHVSRFNAGVRTGDWSSMLELMDADVVLAFEGIPVGPFHGREAVAAAYASMPPDDEIVLLDGGPAYAWSTKPRERAGELRLSERDGAIAALTVVYER